MHVCHFVSLEEQNSLALVHNITFFEDVIESISRFLPNRTRIELERGCPFHDRI